MAAPAGHELVGANPVLCLAGLALVASPACPAAGPGGGAGAEEVVGRLGVDPAYLLFPAKSLRAFISSMRLPPSGTDSAS